MTESSERAGDGWEIRQLVERYASGADRRDGDAVAALFADDGELAMWLDPAVSTPVERRGRDEIAASIRLLSRFEATQHVIASVVIDVDGDVATGATRCTAHHVLRDDDGLKDTVLYLTYTDRFRRDHGRWLLARRELRVQWSNVQGVESI